MSFSTDVPIGSELLGYRIERSLGRGGMGVVYLAEDLRLERKVALKLLAPELAEDERLSGALPAESELAASLDHPNIVPIYEAGEADGRSSSRCATSRAPTCKILLERGTARLRRSAVALVVQVAAALDAAHAHGLVHRDVKPVNILLAEAARGCRARLPRRLRAHQPRRGARRRPVEHAQLVGTVDYIAPEQIQGETVDGRADVYSLGCLLYECLTGAPPFQRASLTSLSCSHTSRRSRRP